MLDPDKLEERASIPNDTETITIDVRVQRIRGKAYVSFTDMRAMNLPDGTESKIANTIKDRIDMRHARKKPVTIGSVTTRVSDGEVVDWNIEWGYFDK